MTTRADWLRSQIAQAQRLCDDYSARDWPFGDGGMAQHVEDLKRELADELANIAPTNADIPAADTSHCANCAAARYVSCTPDIAPPAEPSRIIGAIAVVFVLFVLGSAVLTELQALGLP